MFFHCPVVRFYRRKLLQQEKLTDEKERERKLCVDELEKKLFRLKAEHSEDKKSMQTKESELFAQLTRVMAEKERIQRELESAQQAKEKVIAENERIKIEFLIVKQSNNELKQRVNELTDEVSSLTRKCDEIQTSLESEQHSNSALLVEVKKLGEMR